MALGRDFGAIALDGFATEDVGWGWVRDEPWFDFVTEDFGWGWVRDEPWYALKQNAYEVLHLLFQLTLNIVANSSKWFH